MNTDNVRDEFSLRFCKWAMEDFSREISSDFPFLSKSKSVVGCRFLALIRSLDPETQNKYATILIRRSHKRASEISKCQLNAVEEKFWQQKSKLLINPTKQINFGIDMQKVSIKVDKNRLREIVVKKLEKSIGCGCERDGDLLNFTTTICMNWKVNTLIKIGGKSKLEYCHIIQSSDYSFQIGPNAGIDFFRWLGIAGTTWDLILDDEIEEAVELLSILCSHFLFAVPHLVNGLTFKGLEE